MNSSDYRLSYVLVGAGGSGTSAHRDILTDPTIHVDIILGVDDSGGSTGVFNEVTKYINLAAFGGNQRFIDKGKIVPIGDTRNNCLRLLNYSFPYGEAVSKILDQRVPESIDMREIILNRIGEALKILPLNSEILGEDFESNMINFVDEYLRTFHLHKGDILTRMRAESHFPVSKLKDLSIGNLFLSYFFLTSGSNYEFFDKLKKIGIIPPQIDFHYITDRRHVLLAEDDEGTVVIGEHNVDEWTRPLDLDEFYLSPIDHEGNPTIVSDKDSKTIYGILQPEEVVNNFRDMILNADGIFLSTGSYANLFTQVKLLKGLLSETKAIMFYVSNFAKTMNEVDAHIAIDKLYKIINKPFITLLVNYELASEFINSPEFRIKYRKEGKEFNESDEVLEFLRRNIINPLFMERILPILNLIEAKDSSEPFVDFRRATPSEIIDRGIKHEPQEIADIVVFLTVLYKYLESLDIDSELREKSFNEILTAMRLERFSNSDLQELVRFLRQIVTMEALDISHRIELIQQLFGMLETNEVKFTIESIRTHYFTNLEIH